MAHLLPAGLPPRPKPLGSRGTTPPSQAHLPVVSACSTVALALFLFTLPPLHAAGSQFRHLVGVRGDQLVEGARPFRFLSFNIPNLHLVEDNVVFASDNAWRLPDRFEITDALESVRQAGGTSELREESLAFPEVDIVTTHHYPGGRKYKAYHWPGFASGTGYDEQNLLSLLRREAFAIRGLPVPETPAPRPPRLLPAQDAAGMSPPSNLVGPVQVRHATLVDE